MLLNLPYICSITSLETCLLIIKVLRFNSYICIAIQKSVFLSQKLNYIVQSSCLLSLKTQTVLPIFFRNFHLLIIIHSLKILPKIMKLEENSKSKICLKLQKIKPRTSPFVLVSIVYIFKMPWIKISMYPSIVIDNIQLKNNPLNVLFKSFFLIYFSPEIIIISFINTAIIN